MEIKWLDEKENNCNITDNCIIKCLHIPVCQKWDPPYPACYGDGRHVQAILLITKNTVRRREKRHKLRLH